MFVKCIWFYYELVDICEMIIVEWDVCMIWSNYVMNVYINGIFRV